MDRMLYKTRASSNPKGKPKVYFSCYPDDFDRYFPIISAEILDMQDCSIWYPKDREAERDQKFLADLAEMQLFVMPVTSNLLTGTSQALDVELPFAKEKHIPILPLLQEAGLEALFNRKCGNLQCLDKNQRDSTTDRYEKKLEAYLKSVLIGDEMAQKIRQAFDAYVFLSYRKKDRRYAQELMRLIHGNDFCRDFAIWYDEYLIPGEDFNDAIERALKECDLFALAVTPNLVNEQNYVMCVEFPMARDIHKPILPFVLADTDRDKLRKKYPGIPDCIDAHDSVTVSDVLIQTAHRIAIQVKERDPWHNFFIGLAYLSGIDVEVDHEKAVDLIKNAADEGLPEAAGKLADLYSTGFGVERSYETAVAWQATMVSLMETICDQEPSDANMDKMLRAVRRCGRQYLELGQPEFAKSYFERAFQIGEEIQIRNGSIDALRDLLICYRDLGDVYQSEGNLYYALKYYAQGYELSEGIVQDDPSEKSHRDFVGSCRLLVETYLQIEEQDYRGNGLEDPLPCAMDFCQKGIAMAQTLVEETGVITDRLEFAELLLMLGRIQQKLCCYKDARNCYERSSIIVKQIAREDKTACYLRCLIDANHALGELSESLGEETDSVAYAEENWKIASSLAEETGMLGDRSLLAGCLQRLGDLWEEKEPQRAHQYCLDALSLRRTLADQMETAEIWYDLSVSCYSLMRMALRQNLREQAAQYYYGAMAVLETLAKQHPGMPCYADMARQVHRSWNDATKAVFEVPPESSNLFPGKEVYVLRISLAGAAGNRLPLESTKIEVVAHEYNDVLQGLSDERIHITLVNRDDFYGYRLVGWCEGLDYVDITIRDGNDQILHQTTMEIHRREQYWITLYTFYIHEEGLTTAQLAAKILDPEQKPMKYNTRYFEPYGCLGMPFEDYKELVSQCGGFSELAKRPDAASLLLHRWIWQQDVLGQKLISRLYNSLKNGDFYASTGSMLTRPECDGLEYTGIVGMLLAQDEYWQRLNDDEKARIGAYGVVRRPSGESNGTAFSLE